MPVITAEEFRLALARLECILSQRFMAPGASGDDRILAKSTAEALQSVAGDDEMVAAAVGVLNGDR